MAQAIRGIVTPPADRLAVIAARSESAPSTLLAEWRALPVHEQRLGMSGRLAAELARVTAENARLRQWVQRADHIGGCLGFDLKEPCGCGKRAALGGTEQGDASAGR